MRAVDVPHFFLHDATSTRYYHTRMSLFLYAVLACVALSVLYMGRAKLMSLFWLCVQLASTLVLLARMAWTRVRVKVRARWFKWRHYSQVKSGEPVDPANQPAPHVVMKRPGQRINQS